MQKRKRIRIACVDISTGFAESVLSFVSDRYDFEFTRERDAPYVIHSVGGSEVLKYPGVRLFVTAENISPNFLISDYAMSFDKIVFGDRAVWLPLLRLSPGYDALTKPRKPVEEIMRLKAGFCAYVMSNTSNSAPERSRIFDLLNAYRDVHSGGAWRNNVGGQVVDKRAFQSQCRFVVAFENCSYPGYLTEKFADAALADAIPVYWGDPEAVRLFNPASFINCHDFENLERAVDRVIEIDRNESLYLRMLSEPWFPEGKEPACLRKETFAAFLSNLFDQDPAAAYRRNRGRWGRKYERQMYDIHFRPHAQAFRLIQRGWRSCWHSLGIRRIRLPKNTSKPDLTR